MRERSERSALGLAMCKGANRGKPDLSYQAKCSRSRMCPHCEYKKAKVRAYQIQQRLLRFDEETNGEMVVGVLSLTLPGLEAAIRTADLRTQYDYMTARVTLPGRVGEHSMRGVNKMLTELGASGGTHYIEFTYNNKPWTKAFECWNAHTHTLFWGDDVLQKNDGSIPLKDCSTWKFPDNDTWFGEPATKGRYCKDLSALGFGRRYTLDYADPEELQAITHYCNKVAYATKPFVAPLAKSEEISEFLSGIGGTEPRLARPFGDATKDLGLHGFLEWDKCQRKKAKALAVKEALQRSPRDQPNRMHVVNRRV